MATPVSTTVFMRTLKDALEFMDTKIENLTVRAPTMWMNLFRRGAMPLGQGLVRKMNRFYGDVGDQAGLTNWHPIQVSTPGGGGKPAIDACSYQADLIDSALETIDFTGFGTNKRTEDICNRNIRWTWEFEQQVRLRVEDMANVSVSVWENHARERTLKFAGENSRIFLLTNGSPSGTPLSTNYNPFTTTDIVIPRNVDISRLSWSFLEWWHQFFALQCPTGRVAGTTDDPIFGLVTSQFDFTDMIHRDEDLREDLRYASPSVLIDQYASVKQFKGYGLMWDKALPRYNVKAGGTGATTLTLERVLPFVQQATTEGSKWVLNEDYLNAEYAMGIIFLREMFDVLVPPPGPANIGGMKFGAVPSLNGEFHLINIPDRQTNLLGETAFYFARFEAFAKPLANARFATAFLYKRCPQTKVEVCAPCEASGEGTWVTILSAEAVVGDGESASAYTRVRITLSKCLPCESPAEIQLDYDGTGGAEAVDLVLVDGSNAPEYVLGFETAAQWVHGTKIVAGTTTIRCE